MSRLSNGCCQPLSLTDSNRPKSKSQKQGSSQWLRFVRPKTELVVSSASSTVHLLSSSQGLHSQRSGSGLRVGFYRHRGTLKVAPMCVECQFWAQSFWVDGEDTGGRVWRTVWSTSGEVSEALKK